MKSKETLRDLVARIWDAVESGVQAGVRLQMSVSVGVAGTTLTRDESDLKSAAERLLADADAALYRAKQQGRNRVEMA